MWGGVRREEGEKGEGASGHGMGFSYALLLIFKTFISRFARGFPIQPPTLSKLYNMGDLTWLMLSYFTWVTIGFRNMIDEISVDEYDATDGFVDSNALMLKAYHHTVTSLQFKGQTDEKLNFDG